MVKHIIHFETLDADLSNMLKQYEDSTYSTMSLHGISGASNVNANANDGTMRFSSPHNPTSSTRRLNRTNLDSTTITMIHQLYQDDFLLGNGYEKF